MGKLNWGKRAYAVFLLCAATAIALPAQITFTTLHSFDKTDGYGPNGLVQATDGNFYGTTEEGGASDACYQQCGTVFKITPSGTLTTLYSFCSQGGCTDGDSPVAGLIQGTDGNFYGTTAYGGANSPDAGTIFKITPTGTLTTLYSFCSQSGCTDGYGPLGALVQATDGNFYGTTYGGGANGVGTVFKITPSGTLTTLYSFRFCYEGGCTDGDSPYAALVQATDGNFYGTTDAGGANAQINAGTVFKITPSGALTTLYSFCSQSGCTDGRAPYKALVQATDGNFYGTTYEGGANNPGIAGTVFKITPSGALTTLYSFCSQSGCTDGRGPYAALVQATDGNFYGTTVYGGANGNGTVFKITPSGALTTLYSFCSQHESGFCTDGSGPVGALVQATNGNFYGTTHDGGANGYGTVFEKVFFSGVDISKASGDVADSVWQNMSAAGIGFVVVQAWGGGPKPSPYAKDQLVGDGTPTHHGAQNLGMATGAYVLLNYLSNGGNGTYQVDQAVEAVGSGISNLKFMVVDVEPCCGEFEGWLRLHPYALKATITDPASHIQKVVTAGTSGAWPPTTWNDFGGTTRDGTVTWKDTGATLISQTDRIGRISEAATEIQNQFAARDLKCAVNCAVIYTDRGSWNEITGNCDNGTTNNCSNLIALPLWDVGSYTRTLRHKTFIGLDGLRHCGDGVAGLLPFTPYSFSGWRNRSGNQYDFGLVVPPPGQKQPCNGNAFFGVTAYDVDLDFFDPALFQ